MSFEVERNLDRADDPSSANQAGSASNEPMDSEEEEIREPNQPPPGLMHKKRHPAVWIALALLLGGVIALVLTALVTS